MLDQLVTVSASRRTSGPGTYVVITPSVTITLENWNYWDDPDAAIVIKDMSGSATPAITVLPSGPGAAIDSQTVVSINKPYEGMRFTPYKNGSTWLIENISVPSTALTGQNIGEDVLTVTAVNTLSNLSRAPDGQVFALFVEGRPFFALSPTPAFTYSGTVVTWISTLYSLVPGNEVIALYTSAV